MEITSKQSELRKSIEIEGVNFPIKSTLVSKLSKQKWKVFYMNLTKGRIYIANFKFDFDRADIYLIFLDGKVAKIMRRLLYKMYRRCITNASVFSSQVFQTYRCDRLFSHHWQKNSFLLLL